MVRPERFELPTFCLEVLGFEILNALSSVAYGREPLLDPSSVGLHGLQLEVQPCIALFSAARSFTVEKCCLGKAPTFREDDLS